LPATRLGAIRTANGIVQGKSTEVFQKSINRQDFNRTLALSPLGIGLLSTAFAQLSAAPTDSVSTPSATKKSVPQYGGAPPIHEKEPFARLTAHGANLSDWIQPVAGKPLTFRASGEPSYVPLRPLNQSWERFAVYWQTS